MFSGYKMASSLVFDVEDNSEEMEMMEIGVANPAQNVEVNEIPNAGMDVWNAGSMDNDQHSLPLNMSTIRNDQMDYVAHPALNNFDALPEEKITAEIMPSANLEEISKFSQMKTK